MFMKPLWQTVWTQISIGAVCSGSTLFASIPNSSAMLGNSVQQTTSADDIFFLALRDSVWCRPSDIVRKKFQMSESLLSSLDSLSETIFGKAHYGNSQ